MTGHPGIARLDLAAHRPKPYAVGPYKLTSAEGAALVEQVRDSMPLERFRKLTVLELLDAYQDRKAAFLIKAMSRSPLRFVTKTTSSDDERADPQPATPRSSSEPSPAGDALASAPSAPSRSRSAGGGGLGEVAPTASGDKS